MIAVSETDIRKLMVSALNDLNNNPNLAMLRELGFLEALLQITGTLRAGEGFPYKQIQEKKLFGCVIRNKDKQMYWRNETYRELIMRMCVEYLAETAYLEK